MSTQSSQNRQVKNEQFLRRLNKRAEAAIKNYFSNGPVNPTDMPLEFNCECSDLACGECVTMPIKRYEQLHARKDRFVLVKGHETDTVEKVVQDLGDYIVVEKFALDPR